MSVGSRLIAARQQDVIKTFDGHQNVVIR